MIPNAVCFGAFWDCMKCHNLANDYGAFTWSGSTCHICLAFKKTMSTDIEICTEIKDQQILH